MSDFERKSVRRTAYAGDRSDEFWRSPVAELPLWRVVLMTGVILFIFRAFDSSAPSGAWLPALEPILLYGVPLGWWWISARRRGYSVADVMASRPLGKQLAWAAATTLAALGVRLGWLTFLSTFDLVPAYWSALTPSSAGSAGEASRLIAVVAVAPCAEELLFRGLIFRRCLRRYGALSAALWSSLLFGICHFDAVGAGLFGLVLAGLYIQSKSLWVAVAAHSFANLVVARGPYVKELLNAHGALAWAIAAVQLGCLPWLAWFLHRSLRSLRS